jgi:hypothetical protein
VNLVRKEERRGPKTWPKGTNRDIPHPPLRPQNRHSKLVSSIVSLLYLLMKSMLHGVRGRGITGRGMRKNVPKFCVKRRNGGMKSTKSSMMRIPLLNRSIAQRSKVRCRNLVCMVKMG